MKQSENPGVVMVEHTPIYSHNVFEKVHKEFQRACKTMHGHVWISFDSRDLDKLNTPQD